MSSASRVARRFGFTRRDRARRDWTPAIEPDAPQRLKAEWVRAKDGALVMRWTFERPDPPCADRRRADAR